MNHGRHMKPARFIKVAMALAVAGALTAPQANARVTRIVIDQTVDLTNPTTSTNPYQQLTGRAFGELDPNDPHNVLITDIQLAPRNARGNVEYVASFRIRKPKDMSMASGLL